MEKPWKSPVPFLLHRFAVVRHGGFLFGVEQTEVAVLLAD